MNLRAALACLFLSLAAACSVADPAARKVEADAMANEARLLPLTIETASFDLYARIRTTGATDRLTVYIEGDGFAWKRTNEISADPTPLNPVALHLAAADPSPAVAWLARPCQFTGGLTARGCADTFWTEARYGETVIAAMNEAVDELKAQTGAAKLDLVGYSGGGTVAALLALRRDDIATLRTVASPLDTDAFTSVHGVSRLSSSLNPAENAPALATLPQIHYAGEDDEIVPAEINRRFLARMGESRCTALVTLPDMDHHDWAEIWPSLMARMPACR
ncbi:alpha/beta hydrolase [Parvibaculum sp.]|jgi:pimeloyl-ACP methyl ester carboxylesterase|uniref:alpha/beta hydrolase n=1 Tax=Parvibaculum sp. TaxID=2024848 RepID=UPI002FDA832E